MRSQTTCPPVQQSTLIVSAYRSLDTFCISRSPFQVFKSTLISFRLRSLLTFNVVALVAGPIILVLIWLMAAVIGEPDHEHDAPPPVPPKQTSSHSPPAGESSSAARPPARRFGTADDTADNDNSIWSKVKKVLVIVWQQSSFWIALFLTVIAQALYVWGYVALNPFVSSLDLFFVFAVELRFHPDRLHSSLHGPPVSVLPCVPHHRQHVEAGVPIVSRQASNNREGTREDDAPAPRVPPYLDLPPRLDHPYRKDQDRRYLLCDRLVCRRVGSRRCWSRSKLFRVEAVAFVFV